MKNLLPLLILILCFSAFGQTKKPANRPISSQISDTAKNEQIKKLQSTKQKLIEERNKLLAEFQPTSVEVRQVDNKISEIDAEISRIKSTVDPAEIVKNTKLEALQKQKQFEEANLDKLLVNYTEDNVSVKQAKARIAAIDEEIRNLISSDKSINLTVNDLPNDSTFLLKLIVIQNQRIIELLEKGKKQ